MKNLTHIRTNIKTSEETWNRFKSACALKGNNSGDVLGYFVNLATDNQIEIPVIARKKHEKP